MPATIKDIRDKTGLSLATISKYLNGGNVLPENREKISAAIKELHYHVNDMARSLVTQKTRSVGMAVPSMMNPFYGTLIRYMEPKLRSEGYSLMVCDSMDDGEQEQKNIKFLLRKNVDGLIVIPIKNRIECIDAINSENIPVMTIDWKLRGISSVTIDNEEAGYEAVNYLIAHGHRKIGILYIGTYYTGIGRFKGYRKALAEHGIEPDPRYEIKTDGSTDSAYSSMTDLLALGKDRPTAVFTTNYDMNIGAVMAINDAGYRYPRDISIVGFDDLVIPRVLTPRLTVFEQPIQEMGNAVGSMMLARILHPETVPDRAEHRVFHAFLKEGESVLERKG